MSIKSLRAACADFKRATIYASTHGEGENPVDAWGNTIDWSAIAEWLGLGGWFNEHIAQQTKIIREQGTASENNSTHFQTPRCMVEDKPVVNIQKQPSFQYILMPKN